MADEDDNRVSESVAAGEYENKGTVTTSASIKEIPEVLVIDPPPSERLRSRVTTFKEEALSPETFRYFSPFQHTSPAHSPRRAPIVINAKKADLSPYAKINRPPKASNNKSGHTSSPLYVKLKSPKLFSGGPGKLSPKAGAKLAAGTKASSRAGSKITPGTGATNKTSAGAGAQSKPPLPSFQKMFNNNNRRDRRRFRQNVYPNNPNFIPPQFLPPFYPYPQQFLPPQAYQNPESFVPYMFPFPPPYPVQPPLPPISPMQKYRPPPQPEPPRPPPGPPIITPVISRSHEESLTITSLKIPNNQAGKDPKQLIPNENDERITRTGTEYIYQNHDFDAQLVASSQRQRPEDYPMIIVPPSQTNPSKSTKKKDTRRDFSRIVPSQSPQPRKLRKQSLKPLKPQQRPLSPPKSLRLRNQVDPPSLISKPKDSTPEIDSPPPVIPRPLLQLPANPVVPAPAQETPRKFENKVELRPHLFKRQAQIQNTLAFSYNLQSPRPSSFSLRTKGYEIVEYNIQSVNTEAARSQGFQSSTSPESSGVNSASNNSSIDPSQLDMAPPRPIKQPTITVKESEDIIPNFQPSVFSRPKEDNPTPSRVKSKHGPSEIPQEAKIMPVYTLFP